MARGYLLRSMNALVGGSIIFDVCHINKKNPSSVPVCLNFAYGIFSALILNSNFLTHRYYNTLRGRFDVKRSCAIPSKSYKINASALLDCFSLE